jgi:hypothetical protein
VLSVEIPRPSRPTRVLALSAAVLSAIALAVPAQAAQRAHGAARGGTAHHHHRRSAAPPGPAVLSAPGFDTCWAPSPQAMAAWRTASPYRAIGVYVGGLNRACVGGNLSSDWVHTVAGQGWGLIPIYVGLQAPCVKQKSMIRMSGTDPAQQGTDAADDAASASGALALAAGSPVYFDLEAFNENNQACVRTVTAFLDAWTRQLHVRGYLSGVYGSAGSGMATLAGAVLTQPDFDPPDAIWIARWDQQARTADESVPDDMWVLHQRIKQYQGGHVETYGGSPLEIDTDLLDGPIARIGP